MYRYNKIMGQASVFVLSHLLFWNMKARTLFMADFNTPDLFFLFFPEKSQRAIILCKQMKTNDRISLLICNVYWT